MPGNSMTVPCNLMLNSGAPRPETEEDCAGESGNPIYVDGTLSQPQLCA